MDCQRQNIAKTQHFLINFLLRTKNTKRKTKFSDEFSLKMPTLYLTVLSLVYLFLSIQRSFRPNFFDVGPILLFEHNPCAQSKPTFWPGHFAISEHKPEMSSLPLSTACVWPTAVWEASRTKNHPVSPICSYSAPVFDRRQWEYERKWPNSTGMQLTLDRYWLHVKMREEFKLF